MLDNRMSRQSSMGFEGAAATRAEMEPFPATSSASPTSCWCAGTLSIAVVDLDDWSYGTRRYKAPHPPRLSADAESVAVGLREMGIARRPVFIAPSYRTAVIGAGPPDWAPSHLDDPSVVSQHPWALQPRDAPGRSWATRFSIRRITFRMRVPRDLQKARSHWKACRGRNNHRICALPRRALESGRMREASPTGPEPPRVRARTIPAPFCTTGSTGPGETRPLYLHHQLLSECSAARHHSWRWDPGNGSRGVDSRLPAFPCSSPSVPAAVE